MTEKLIFALLAIALIAAAVYFLNRNRNGNGDSSIVLGQEMADAMKNEKVRSRKNLGSVSPFPEGQYLVTRGEWGLINPKPVEMDETLRELSASFLNMSSEQRDEFRGAVSLDEFYTLLEFARRSSVFAVREDNSELIGNGLVAIAMIEAKRTDFRDILVALSLLHHSASKIGMDVRSEFAKAAAIAEPDTAKMIADFSNRPTDRKCLQSSWGFCEVNSRAEFGFVRSGFREYNPRSDLLGIACRIATVFEEDCYIVTGIEQATELPPFWLETPTDKNLTPILKRALGGVTITSQLEDKKHPDAESQQFTLFLVDLDSPDSANQLLRISKEKQPENFNMIGFASGKIFALLIARTFVDGTDSFEDKKSLSRFHDPIDQVIRGEMRP